MTKEEAMIHTLAKENDELKAEIGRLRQALEQQPSDDKVSVEVYKQVTAERDIAIEQLHELGCDFGEIIRTSKDCVSRAEMLEMIKQIQDVGGFIGYSTYSEALYQVNNMSPVTPTHGTCKDCKHWKDSDGAYRRGIGAESKCPINNSRVFEGTYYCADFEKRGDEND